MDNDDLIKALIENGGILEKILFAVAIGVFRGFGKKLDVLNDQISQIDKHIAVMFEKHSRNDARIDILEQTVHRHSNRYHELVNTHIVKIEKNELKIIEIEKRLESCGHSTKRRS